MTPNTQHADLALFPTEQVNANTRDIDQLSVEALLTRMNAEDQDVPKAVAKAIPEISKTVDAIVKAFRGGHKLFYIGAGTSGRLGVLDASECVPTFNTPPELVQGIIAGGDTALRHPVEGAEDSFEDGEKDIAEAGVSAGDVVVGLSASGFAPYVQGAVIAAKNRGCFTGAITCYAGSKLAGLVDAAMVIPVGPEVIAGSTRLKAGTAQKLVLNMLTTGAMIQIGKTYENLMVDVKPTNDKLRARATRIVSTLANVSPEEAWQALQDSQMQVKPAIVMLVKNCDLPTAQGYLEETGGKLRPVLS